MHTREPGIKYLSRNENQFSSLYQTFNSSFSYTVATLMFTDQSITCGLITSNTVPV